MESNQITTVEYVSQMMQDLFYKELKTESEFLDETHFDYLVRAIYFKLMRQLSRESRRLAAEESGYFVYTVSDDMLIWDDVEVEANPHWYYSNFAKSFVLKLKQPFYSFDHDTMGFAVQYVQSSKCGEFTRISPKQAQYLKIVASVSDKNLFYIQNGNVVLVDIGGCGYDKIRVGYVPALGASIKDKIPFGVHMDIIEYGIKFLKELVAEGVVDKTNNQNDNAIIQSELDKRSIK